VRKTSRLAGGAVVLAAVVIAACFGEAKLATSRQAVIVPDRDPVFVGSAMVGSSVTTNPAIVLSPEDETSDDTITSITKNCGSDFALLLSNGGTGARVFCSGGPIDMGSGSDIGVGGETYGSGACVPVTYSFNASFTPTGPGSASCGVTVNYAPTGGGSGSSRLITLDATGVAPTYALTVSPQPSINFSDHPINSTSATTPVTIKNTGTTALVVTGTNSNSSNFIVSSVNGSTFANQPLAVGQSAEYAVACSPKSLGLISGTLTFSSPAGPRTVGLTCNGIGVSNLDITPVPAAFAPTLVGRAPATVNINIRNNGTAATTLTVSLNASTPELTFVAGGNPNGSNLGVGAPATARLQYTAATEHPAGSLGTLTVNYSGGSARNITINGTALTGEIGWAPATLDFGPVCVGATASAQVMVYASAAGDVDIVSVTGAAAPFGVSRTGGTLEGNHGNTIDLIAMVTPTAPGELTDSLTLNTNLPTNPAHAIPLEVTALPAGVTPTPGLVHFGPGRVGMTTAAKTIELSNCGSAPINITAARIEGASAGDFAIVSPENPVMSLPQMGSVEFLVVMSPRLNGSKSAQLVIEHDGGTVVAELDGNGFGGDDGDLVDRGTYYACSTGSGSAVAPIALALLLLRRRRRHA
jgi:MYXO-CTERM domain-containing protein